VEGWQGKGGNKDEGIMQARRATVGGVGGEGNGGSA